jgi:hypothetical protein
MRAIIVLMGLLIMGCGVIYVVASDALTALYNVPVAVTGPDGVCKNITNLSGTGLSGYVPTTTIAEWQSFYNNPPAGVSVAACPVACGGLSYGGYCYYAMSQSAGQSCTQYCATKSGCSVAGMNLVENSLSVCTTVLNGTLPPGNAYVAVLNQYYFGTPITLGCTQYGNFDKYLTLPLSCSTAPIVGFGMYRMACACNN